MQNAWDDNCDTQNVWDDHDDVQDTWENQDDTQDAWYYQEDKPRGETAFCGMIRGQPFNKEEETALVLRGSRTIVPVVEDEE